MVFQSILSFGQVEDFNQTIKNLVSTDFKSMEIFAVQNNHLRMNKKIVHDKEKKLVIINDFSPDKEENLKEIHLKVDDFGNVLEELKIFKGLILDIDKLVNKEYFSKKSFKYDEEKIEISTFSSTGEIYLKEIVLRDNKGRKMESISVFTTADDIVISEIAKYKWTDDGFDIEKKQFSYPKQTLVGSYILNKDGYAKSFKGFVNFDKKIEDLSGDWIEKTNKYDFKGNIIQVFGIENNKKTLIEERKIVY